MALLVSVNVGLPQDVEWQGRIVRTAIWKAPVVGRVRVRRLNIDGDGQGDLQGHGGEHRAVMVYQLASYRHWEAHLGRPLEHGAFGENLTVDGLADDEVCVGDRYRIGSTLLEVTQPRVTCYRVGIRLQNPQMPSLLVSHKRPGFYCRVIEEGTIGAGDMIVKETCGDGMTVAAIDALLYLPAHPKDQLEQAIRIPALSEGWRASFAALLEAGPDTNGNAGLADAAAPAALWTGFRAVRVCAIQQESASVRSLVLETTDGRPLPAARGGQFVVLRLPGAAPDQPLLRSYSLSGESGKGHYRISVKRGGGAGSAYVHGAVKVGDVLSISAPRGGFVLSQDHRPVVFWSAGIGVTPVLAMLHELVASHDFSSNRIFWIYGTQNGLESVFASEVDALMHRLPQGRKWIAFSRPAAGDVNGVDFDATGRIDVNSLAALQIPQDAQFYLCGPLAFMTEARDGLRHAGFPAEHISSELFGPREALRPGINAALQNQPHPPPDASEQGVLVSFVRSGLSVHWNERHGTLLELAEACDVPVRWSCRSGVCHTCETAIIEGEVRYSPDPLQAPADGRLLICCAMPVTDIQLDL